METKIFKIIKSHWFLAILAIVSGFLIIWPFFYFQITLGDQYRGILPEIIDDGLFYVARIKDVIDGYPTLGNVYLFEHKNQLPQQLFLPEWLLAQPLKLLDIDAVQGRILYSFILPALAFIFTYLVFYYIHSSKLWAGAFATFLFFGLYLFKFSRPVIPQFVFIFWLSQFIFLWRLTSRPDSKKILLFSILNFGALFYLYPFYWTFYLVFLIVLSFFLFFKDKLLSKNLLVILASGLLIGFVYFYMTFLASQFVEYQETLTRLQLVFSRSPSEFKSVLLALMVLILFAVLIRLKAVKMNKEVLFFIAGFVSILLVTNQNIITGQKFEFGHYRMQAVFLFVFALYYLFTLINKVHLKSIWQWAVLLFIGLFVYQGVNSYVNRTLKISERDIYIQKYAAVFKWLNENTPKDSVVYANEGISSLIPVYTADNVFYSRYANLFIISDDEVGERFILNNYFEKFDRDFVVENERAIWGVRYVDRYGDAVRANKWRRLLNLRLKDEIRLPEEGINKVLALAGQIQKDSFEKGLKKYRADYFIWDKNKNPDWQLNNQNFLKNIFEDKDFVIYRIL